MSYSMKQNVEVFNSFLTDHLKSQKKVLAECLSEHSLSDYLFEELDEYNLPRCSSLSDVLKIRSRRISKAYNKKFTLDVKDMQAALAHYLDLDFENSPSQENDTSSLNSSISSIDTSKYVRRDHFDHSFRDLSNQVASQSDKNTTLSRSMCRLTTGFTSSLASGLVQSRDMNMRGVWIPQHDPKLLDHSNWQRTQKPAKSTEEDGRLRCDEGMWYVFERELIDAAKRNGNELTVITKKVFGAFDVREYSALPSSDPMKRAMKQLAILVSKAKSLHKLSIEAHRIFIQQKKNNPSGSSFDEESYISGRMPTQIEAEMKNTNYRINKSGQNKRYKQKAKEISQEKDRRLDLLELQLSEKDRRLEQLQCELVEKDRTISNKEEVIAKLEAIVAEKTKCIEEKNEEIKSIRYDEDSANEAPLPPKISRTNNRRARGRGRG